jgi:sulfur-carrier protein
MNGQEFAQTPSIEASTGVTVRFWAAARAAAGVETTVVAAGGLTGVIDAVQRKYPNLSVLLPRCSLLLDGVAVGREDVGSTSAPTGSTLEILPPFAGG